MYPQVAFIHVTHVYPIGDLREHVTENDGVCWCKPDIDWAGIETIVLHNSMDGREKFETGERKFS